MAYYDLHVHSAFSEGESSLEDLANRAKILGYQGICYSSYYKGKDNIEELNKKIKDVSGQTKIEIFSGIEARNVNELNKLVKMRREFDILLARGSDINFNRKAVETAEVDILTHPEFGRKDSGLNHIMMKIATKNNVAIEINFREILLSSKASRSHILRNITTNVSLCKKYKTPIVICSGAISQWQMKDPIVLQSLGSMLGLELGETKKCLTEIPLNITNTIRERRSEKWIMPGVKEI